MDSRLLNVVYDDPFDGNYVKYDNDAEFWSSGSETMGMQLTETLHGILPIAPTEDFRKDDNTTSINIQTSNKNAFNYEDFAGQHLAGGAIEIVTVNPHGGYDTDSEEDSDDDDEVAAGELEFDRQSEYSNATFRTRTDSSSIGDYESHTSDYDDTDDDDDDEEYDANIMANNALMQTKSQINVTSNGNPTLIDLHSSLVAPDDLILDNTYHKSRTFSTNTINSDVDGFGLQIDANNFDLAEFITKDDFTLQTSMGTSTTATTTTTNTTIAANTKINVLPKNVILNNAAPLSMVQVISSKHDDSDSDSDVIVDVETVEVDEDDASSLRKATEILKPTCIETQTPTTQPEDDVAYVDNVKTDPSWCPTQPVKKPDSNKIEEKSPIQKQNFGRNFSIVPSKKQCDILKGKAAKGKAKAATKPTKATTNSAKNIKIENSQLKVENALRKTGIGMGGKNLALLKHERISISEHSSEDNNLTPKKLENVKTSSQIKHEQQTPIIPTTSEKETPAQNDRAQAVKRKLNLEEYKKRRGEPCLTTTTTATKQTNAKHESYKIPKLEINTLIDKHIKATTAATTTTPTKHSEAVTSIVKSLKEQQKLQQKPLTDPITEARNKVLRMQELKRAQQMRIIDSTLSAKVPRVTKLLPLREIVKDTPYLNEEEKKKTTKSQKSQVYEEIIIVSTSCNTDISMPPIPNQNIQPVNNASRSLLKSSVLLSTISNSFEKVKATDNVKISTSSLISSIQDVVVKKSLPIEDVENGSSKDSSKTVEHYGENKIIMHLRKDRIRKRMCTMATQTDLQPEFPPLPLPKLSMKHKSRERIRKQRKRQYRKHNDKSVSSSSENSSDDQTDTNSSSSLTRSRDNSCSSSVERMRTYDSAIGTGGYSSRSSRKHRSSISSSYSESADRKARGQRRQRRTSYTKRSTRRRSRSPYSSSSSYTSDSDRSRSPLYRRSSRSRSRSRSRRSSYRQHSNNNNSFLDRNVSQPAVEERRIVYVGRIEQETTKDMLRRKFLPYGTIKQISIHYKDTGMKYGFVTFQRSQDAFTAIDTSTRDPQISMYDVSFGGRRAFCRASYADLDNAGINTYQSYVFPQPVQQPREEDSFEALLQKMKAKLNANKPTTAAAATAAPPAASAEATPAATATNNKI